MDKLFVVVFVFKKPSVARALSTTMSSSSSFSSFSSSTTSHPRNRTTFRRTKKKSFSIRGVFFFVFLFHRFRASLLGRIRARMSPSRNRRGERETVRSGGKISPRMRPRDADERRTGARNRERGRFEREKRTRDRGESEEENRRDDESVSTVSRGDF